MFLNTPTNRFLTDRKYEVLYPPTYGVYTGRLNYLKASGKFWSARVSDCIIAHKGKIFIGNGDYDKNTGECPICSYDPTTNQWTVEGTLPTEHILNIREIDDTLWIPCQDHTGGDVDARVFRRKADGTWEIISIPFPAQHSFDVAKIDGKIWVDLAQVPDANKSAVAVSEDGGVTWSKIQCYEANGTTLSTANNRIESGIIKIGDIIYAINTLGIESFETVVYQYDVVQNKFLRLAKNFVPPEEDPELRFVINVNRNVLQRRYNPASNLSSVGATIFRIGSNFLGKTFLYTASLKRLSNAASLYSSGNYYQETYFSKMVAYYIPDGTELMYYLRPPLGEFPDGSKTVYRYEGDYRFTSLRDIVDACVDGGKAYLLQVSLRDYSQKTISTGSTVSINVPFVISIYSTTDNVNYTLEFESTFPTWPTCFTVLDGFAYICMGGDIHLESPWVGAVVKAKMEEVFQ